MIDDTDTATSDTGRTVSTTELTTQERHDMIDRSLDMFPPHFRDAVKVILDHQAENKPHIEVILALTKEDPQPEDGPDEVTTRGRTFIEASSETAKRLAFLIIDL